MPEITTQWYHVLDLDELLESRVKTVVAGHKSLALTHYQGQYGALDNRCPHQGGPLGEGSIENGLLRCPWHGWDYCPLTGKPPGDLDVDDALATFPVEVRADVEWKPEVGGHCDRCGYQRYCPAKSEKPEPLSEGAREERQVQLVLGI